MHLFWRPPKIPDGAGSSRRRPPPPPPPSPGVKFVKGNNELDKAVLCDHSGSLVEVYLYGAHVTSWKNPRGEELLFVSKKALFESPKAIRGGIPICFPQFSDLGPFPPHGFARNRLWTIDTDPSPFPTNIANKFFLDLILKPSEEDLQIWPHSWEFRLRVALGPGGRLILTSRVRNINSNGKPFKFTFAYRNYLSVSDVSDVRIEGLETLHYLDNLKNMQRFTEQEDSITFESEINKIYLRTPTQITVMDHEKRRTVVIRKDGLPDTVVWNPWDQKKKKVKLPDLEKNEYKQMVCVESACIESIDTRITPKPGEEFTGIILQPGQEWTGRQELISVPSCYTGVEHDP